MFLANSLNDKLKRSLSQFDLIQQNECKFPYKKSPQNPKLLINQKENYEYEDADDFYYDHIEEYENYDDAQDDWGDY